MVLLPIHTCAAAAAAAVAVAAIHTAAITSTVHSVDDCDCGYGSADMCVNSIRLRLCVTASANRFFFFQPYV